MFINNFFAEREQWNSQVEENSARYAFAYGKAHSSGWGEVVVADPIMFGITYVHEPTVAYGYALDDDDQLVDGRFPRCSGGVLRWVRTPEEYYVGAYVLVTVATADPLIAAQSLDVAADFGQDPGYDITHSWTFGALAIKDLG